eukprot:244734-Amphidinium_carterae.1
MADRLNWIPTPNGWRQDTVVTRTFAGVELATTLTLVKVFGCPFWGSSNLSIELSLLATVRALEEGKPQRLVSDCKGVVSYLHTLRAGRRQPKSRNRDLESRALAALAAGVQIVWMKPHQSDKGADEGCVERPDLQGSRVADVAANKGTSEHVPLEQARGYCLSGCADFLALGGSEVTCSS